VIEYVLSRVTFFIGGWEPAAALDISMHLSYPTR
jgi:hypothetical protein